MSRPFRWMAVVLFAARLACCPWLLCGSLLGAEEQEVFSGPQPSEKLPALRLLGVFDDLAGQEFDPVAQAEGKPTLIIIVHQVTRPAAALTRTLTHYAASRQQDGLACGVVWLAADPSEAEAYLKRARRSLGFEAPVGISLDGAEGPGAYGLNRNVGLTILVANEGAVTANYALIQPSMTDAPAILADVVKLIGGEAPTLEQLQAQQPKPRRP